MFVPACSLSFLYSPPLHSGVARCKYYKHCQCEWKEFRRFLYHESLPFSLEVCKECKKLDKELSPIFLEVCKEFGAAPMKDLAYVTNGMLDVLQVKLKPIHRVKVTAVMQKYGGPGRVVCAEEDRSFTKIHPDTSPRQPESVRSKWRLERMGKE